MNNDITGHTWDGDGLADDGLDALEDWEIDALSEPWKHCPTTGVLSSAVLRKLDRLRTIQQRRRRHGRMIAMPDPASSAHATERSLRGTQFPRAIQLMNRTFAVLIVTLEAEGGPLPDLDAVVLTEQYVELHLPGPRPPVAPFTTDPSRPHVWVCWADSPALRPGDRLDPPCSPYPALVSVGWDQQGRTVLIDLEQVGVLNLTGDLDCARRLAQAIATELAAALFTLYLPVALVGQACAELTTVLDDIHVTTADVAVAELRSRGADLRSLLHILEADSPRAARPHDDGSNWCSYVVLSPTPHSATAQLVDTLAAWPLATASVVTVSPPTLPMPTGSWTLNCQSADDPVLLPGSGMPVHLQQLDDARFADIIEILTIGQRTDDVPGPDWMNPQGEAGD
ncbi:hypothetical protein ACFPFX_04605 [Streptomyces mauvecolor]|uniref:Uncharacterized protein n=1 Tax=Streptomyces mauvecolor TaxID=58345 RepID=A0ABV9UJE8_9ACTN